jgi:hypothetical protein
LFQACLKAAKGVCVVSIVLLIGLVFWPETGYCTDSTVNTIRYDFPDNGDHGLVGLAVGYFDFTKRPLRWA